MNFLRVAYFYYSYYMQYYFTCSLSLFVDDAAAVAAKFVAVVFIHRFRLWLELAIYKMCLCSQR